MAQLTSGPLSFFFSFKRNTAIGRQTTKSIKQETSQGKKGKQKKEKPQDSPEVKAIKRQIRETKQAVEKVENDITKLEAEQAKIESQLADNSIYEDAEKLEKTQVAFQQVQDKLAKVNEEWENLVMTLEELEE